MLSIGQIQSKLNTNSLENDIKKKEFKKNKQFIQSPQREWLKNNEMIQDMINSTKFNERSFMGRDSAL